MEGIDESKYWWTPAEKGLTEQEITDKLEVLWADEKARVTRKCPDCGVEPGKEHIGGCDVARCLNCKGQALSCGCPEDKLGWDVWDGTWPGTKECYELRLLTWSDPRRIGGTGWRFCLNTLAEINATKK